MENSRKVQVLRLRMVRQHKIYKYRKLLINKIPFTYEPLCTDFLDYKYFTEEGIARYLYENYGFGTFMIQSWKWYSKCFNCKLSFKNYKDIKQCPRCSEKKKIWFKGFYNLCIYQIIKRGNTYIYNPIDVTNISRSRVWRRNLSRLV